MSRAETRDELLTIELLSGAITPWQAKSFECRDLFEFFARGLVRRIEELREQAPHGPILVARFDLLQPVTSLGVALLDDAVVPPAIVLLDDPRDHSLLAESMVDLPAGLAWLADFEQGAAKVEAVADPHCLFGQPLGMDILSESGWAG